MIFLVTNSKFKHPQSRNLKFQAPSPSPRVVLHLAGCRLMKQRKVSRSLPAPPGPSPPIFQLRWTTLCCAKEELVRERGRGKGEEKFCPYWHHYKPAVHSGPGSWIKLTTSLPGALVDVLAIPLINVDLPMAVLLTQAYVSVSWLAA